MLSGGLGKIVIKLQIRLGVSDMGEARRKKIEAQKDQLKEVPIIRWGSEHCGHTLGTIVQFNEYCEEEGFHFRYFSPPQTVIIGNPLDALRQVDIDVGGIEVLQLFGSKGILAFKEAKHAIAYNKLMECFTETIANRKAA
jgi:hypothetical protein